MAVTENLRQVLTQVQQLAGGRPVTVLAVSKGQSTAIIREAWAVGQRAFGESYVQEALEKQAQLQGLALEWHFIGPVQSNKTGPIARHFQWVHGVTRLKIAGRLSEARQEAGLPPLNVCVQVNLSGESSKAGVVPAEVATLVAAVTGLPGLRLRGLMTLPEATPDIALQHQRFATLRRLQTTLNEQGYALDTLSMGMSQDFASAIAEGSTIVRIGTTIFGERQKTS
ncbi:MAG: YggS family pyridoxal phosphate-dependent enzyme [Burkholderiales bacterium]|nr:YggS family pyridoxal phosphate-dependent enzyme [Ferrovum sp.]